MRFYFTKVLVKMKAKIIYIYIYIHINFEKPWTRAKWPN